jgi:hypothetical protein
MARVGTPLKAAALLLLLAACGGDSSGPDTSRNPAGITVVSGDNQSGKVAATLAAPLVVRVTDTRNRPASGVTVAFTVTQGAGTLSAGSAVTGSDGSAQVTWTLGTRVSDAQQVQARVQTGSGVLTATFGATATAGDPATLTVVAGNNQTRPPGAAVDTLSARVTDTHGNAVPGVTVNWTVTAGGGSIAPSSSVTNAEGIAKARWTLGPALGPQTAQATVAGLSAAPFTAQAVAGPTITQVSPDPVTPGAQVTINGTNFGATAGENMVAFNGTAAVVQQASATQLTVIAPCVPSGSVTIAVTANGGSAQLAHTMAVPNPLTLGVGESLLFNAGSVCRELSGGSRYMLTVVYGSSGASSVGFTLRGATGAATGAASLVAGPTPRITLPPLRGELLEHARRLEDHVEILAANRQLAERLGSARVAAHPEPGTLGAQSFGAAAIAVGDTLTVKIPDADGNLCSIAATVRARVVFVGDRGVVLEDVASPLAGQIDSTYRAMGQEFETIGWDVITNNFGNPLAIDAQNDANGKFFMLFSRQVNDFERNVAGFVTNADFFPTAVCPSSNRAEIFYGIVPTDASTGYGDGTADNPANWSRSMRSIVVHETKHIASYAERASRDAPNENGWLEESTAVIAEELFARRIFGYEQNANTAFQESLYCERRPDPTRSTHPPQCWHKPFVMYGYFAYVNQYLSSIESRSPLGPIGPTDATFYGSGWSFIRWAADQYGTSESAFFRALVQEPSLQGVANLEARTGRTLPELLADWALASALDDRPNFDGQRIHTLPSWNTRDIYMRMNQEIPSAFPNEFPLLPRPLSFGGFLANVPALRAGSAAVFELGGTLTGRQLLHLTGPSGSPPVSDIRMKIVRIE